MSKDLEIGRDPGGNTDFGQYILQAIRAAKNGQHIRVISHGKPVAMIIPPRTEQPHLAWQRHRPLGATGPSRYDPVPDLAALIDGLEEAARDARDAGLPGSLITGPYARLRGGLLLDEPVREYLTTEQALRELLHVKTDDQEDTT